MTPIHDSFEDELAGRLSEFAAGALPPRTSAEEVARKAMSTPAVPMHIASIAAVILVAAVGTTFVLGGIAGDPPLPLPAAGGSVTPAGDGQPRPTVVGTQSLAYTCGGHPFTEDVFDGAEIDLSSTAEGAAVATLIESNTDAGLLPSTGWHYAGREGDRVSFVALNSGVYTQAQVKADGDAWRVVNWGGCEPELDLPELNAATWHLAPDQEIRPDTTSFYVDVRERACTGGQSSADRVQAPIVSADEDRVVVAFTVALPEGPLTNCIANPTSRHLVELPFALAGRSVVDAGTLPWKERIGAQGM